MADKKKKINKNYNFRQIIICEKCGKVANIPGPCIECGNITFITKLKAQEI